MTDRLPAPIFAILTKPYSQSATALANFSFAEIEHMNQQSPSGP